MSDDQWKPINCPPELVARLMETNTTWDEEAFPPLFGLIEVPTLRKDGSVLDEPGYDRMTGIWFDPGYSEFPKIGDKPTKADGQAAMARLQDLLCDFPFIDAEGYEGVSLSVALSMLLTGPVRRCLDLAPAFAATADEAESGKTELMNTAAIMTVGRDVACCQFSSSEEERRKAIGAALYEGDSVLFFDNVDDVPIGGTFFEKVLTKPTVTDRLLGSTKTYTAPTHALFLFNGNDISVVGAATTRVLLTRLVPTMELAKRRFKYRNLSKHVMENHPALVADVLTALRAWIVNRPDVDPDRDTMRFPEWDRLIAQALVWYGYADPVRGGDELREVDPVKEGQRAVIRAWVDQCGEAIVKAADLLRCAEGVVQIGDQQRSRPCPHVDCVRAALAELAGSRPADVSTKTASRYIKALTVVKGLNMDWTVKALAADRNGVTRYRLEWTGDPAAKPGEPADPEPIEDNPEDWTAGE